MKIRTSLRFLSILANFLASFKQGSGRGAASGGSEFCKFALPLDFCQFSRFFLRLSSRGLAGVLPPAGQIFEKWHLLENFVNLGKFFNAFEAGV